MKLTVDKNLRTPLYWQISDQIKEMILRGELIDGAILPSERILAKIAGVHRNTVIKAYAMLKAEDLVESHRGVGYVVSYPDVATEKTKKRKVNWRNLIKDEYQDMEHTFDDIFLRFGEGNYISFSTGMPPAVYSEKEIGVDLANILAEQGGVPFFLSPYQGDKVLRQQIASYLRTKGIKAGLSQIQIMSETNQALDFIVSTIVNEGDAVITEEPVSPDVYRELKLAGCKLITVPVDQDGMICDNLDSLIEKHKPKFIYVNSSYHDPTGGILSLERRKKLLEISSKYRLPIIEEDAASELSFEDMHLPAIKSMDTQDNVIYIYSFALSFIPGLSMAFVVASEKLIKSLSYLVSVRIMSLDWITQKLIAKYITDGKYFEKVNEIAALNKSKKDLMCGYLNRGKSFGIDYYEPKGGVYIWCKLPDGIDNKAVVSAASRRGVAVIPGEIFYPGKNRGQNHIRLNYSYETISNIKKGMEILLEIIKELVP